MNRVARKSGADRRVHSTRRVSWTLTPVGLSLGLRAFPRGSCPLNPSPFVVLSAGLVEEKHIRAMGESVWLYLHLLRLTPIRTAWVKRGHAISTRELSTALGIPRRTVRNWLDRLERSDYIVIRVGSDGAFRIGICKRKWWIKGLPVHEPVALGGPLQARRWATTGPAVGHYRPSNSTKRFATKQLTKPTKRTIPITIQGGVASLALLASQHHAPDGAKTVKR